MKFFTLLTLALAQTASCTSAIHNLIVNGQFQKPNVHGGWQVFQGGIQGWQSKSIQIGHSSLYNHRWTSNQVCQLDSHYNSEISQVIHTHQPFVGLSLDYAAREHVPLQTSKMEILWNGQVIQHVCPTDYNLNHIEIKLQAIPGQNTLTFRATGNNDSYGITIDNIKAVPLFTGNSHAHTSPDPNTPFGKNFVYNGNFQKPQVSGWQLFQNGVEGWEGRHMQIGKAHLYNSKWPNAAHNQVCQLDSNGNNEISQKVRTNYPTVTLALDYAAREHVALQSSQMLIFWNNNLAQQVHPSDYNVNHIELPLMARDGENTLTFRGTGTNDGLGITIDNVQIIPDESSISRRKDQSYGNNIDGSFNGLRGSYNYLQGDYNSVDGDKNFVFGHFNHVKSQPN